MRFLLDSGIRVPDPKAFVHLFDLSRDSWYAESLPDSMEMLLRVVAEAQGVELPAELVSLLDRMWSRVGDHPVPRENIEALHAFHAHGLRNVIATNSCRPVGRREETMRRLGLDFVKVVSSAEEGVAKPHPLFYDAVILAAGVEPHEIVFVGDNRRNDVSGPRFAGMRTAFVDRRRDKGLPPEREADGTLVLSHFSQFKVEHLDYWEG
ncbi:hypothetical protein GCM10010400_29230 [Streptomyces aculeolatus]